MDEARPLPTFPASSNMNMNLSSSREFEVPGSTHFPGPAAALQNLNAMPLPLVSHPTAPLGFSPAWIAKSLRIEGPLIAKEDPVRMLSSSSVPFLEGGVLSNHLATALDPLRPALGLDLLRMLPPGAGGGQQTISTKPFLSSEVEGHTRSDKPGPKASMLAIAPRPQQLDRMAPPTSSVPKRRTEYVDAKKLAKREANRRSAQLCRQRKKQMLQELEDENVALSRHRMVLSTLSDMVFSFDGHEVLVDVYGNQQPPELSLSSGEKPNESTAPVAATYTTLSELSESSVQTPSSEAVSALRQISRNEKAAEAHKQDSLMSDAQDMSSDSSEDPPAAWKINFASQAVEKTLLYDHQELLRRGFFDIVSYDSRARLISLLRDVVSRHSEIFQQGHWRARSPVPTEAESIDTFADASFGRKVENPACGTLERKDSASPSSTSSSYARGSNKRKSPTQEEPESIETVVEPLCSNLFIRMMKQDGTVVTARTSAVVAMTQRSVEVICSIRPVSGVEEDILHTNPTGSSSGASSFHSKRKKRRHRHEKLKPSRKLSDSSRSAESQNCKEEHNNRPQSAWNSEGTELELQGATVIEYKSTIVSGQQDSENHRMVEARDQESSLNRGAGNEGSSSPESSNGVSGAEGDIEDGLENVSDTSSSGSEKEKSSANEAPRSFSAS